VAGSLIGQRPGAAAWQDWQRQAWPRFVGLIGYTGLITLLFAQPLTRLAALALQNDLHSYIPAVPLISGYLLYTRPTRADRHQSSVAASIVIAVVAMAMLAATSQLAPRLTVNDNLTLMMLAYVSFVVAGGFLFLGSQWMAGAAFPVAFLLFIIPLPDAAVDWLERALVAASADVAAMCFVWTGTPLLREGNSLTLPNIVLEVVRECSGIRSTVVLFITSILGSHLFLKSTWRRAVLIAFVVPLAVVRNGFRILVIGLLCVHIGPHMSESFIHRRGGPFFFALSLVPLLLLLSWLRRRDTSVDVPHKEFLRAKVPGDRLSRSPCRSWISQFASRSRQSAARQALPRQMVLPGGDDGSGAGEFGYGASAASSRGRGDRPLAHT
jgi:exosortase C (VPDSG-CTERM-specific)